LFPWVSEQKLKNLLVSTKKTSGRMLGCCIIYSESRGGLTNGRSRGGSTNGRSRGGSIVSRKLRLVERVNSKSKVKED
jgi:hypothetical protein